MAELRIVCPSKVNLGLLIKGKRPDGYHLLQTLFYPITAHQDEVRISTVVGEECTVAMPGFGEDLPLTDNLCHKAWALLRKEFPGQVHGVHIEVTKRIPAGAGMAGGSTDAAGVLKGLNEMFGLGASREKLAHVGQQLGADVPFFLHEGPMFAEGIGEQLTPWPLDLSGYRWEFHFPGVHSSTPAAFRALDWSRLQPETELRDLLRLPVAEWRGVLRNDLEGPVFEKFPQLKAQKELFYEQGAIYASMTGSGSAIFAIFEP
jgi:4-diphosphocytidyl-2-C-methyl-D-erythritol kinase